MNRRRLLAFAAIGAVPVLVLADACTFPSVSFLSVDAAGASSSGAVEAGPSSEAGPTPQKDAETDDGDIVIEDHDGEALTDAAVPDDASQVDAAGCSGRCDCDGDQYLALGCQDYAPGDDNTKPILGKDDDCDDTNSFIHPGQASSEVPESYAPRTPPGDWDCSGKTEKYYNEDNCASSNVLQGCPGSSFAGTIKCGEEAAYYGCKSDGLLPPHCTTGNKIDDRKQGCH